MQRPATPAPEAPPATCALCPRLAAFRADNRRARADWHNAPVPSFGSLDARFLVVGLAPGLRGANATGRPFTGDYAGELLYGTLIRFGLAEGTYGTRAEDGLRLVNTRITNAVRCVPPGNRPTVTETRTCGAFLKQEIGAMPKLACIITLGSVAHGSVLRALDIKPSMAPFIHGRAHRPPGGPDIVASYHCSRLNTNTGRLTPAMFEDVFATARRAVDRSR